MGYCPRCGENSPYGPDQERGRDFRPTLLRIPVDSRVVTIPPDVADGGSFAYGGSRFRLRRDGRAYQLEIVE